MRVAIAATLALLLLAAPAGAKTGWEADRDWQSLVPGQRTDVELTAIDHADMRPVARFEGLRPTLVLTENLTGKEHRFTGSPASARGVSTVAVTVPSAAVWNVTVEVEGEVVGGWQPVQIGDPASQPPRPAAPAAPSAGDDGGVPAGLVAVVVLGALVLAAGLALRLRRPRLGGAG